MTRTVAIGAVIGFVATVIVLALWERSSGTPTPSVVDAGAQELQFIPNAGRGVMNPSDRRVERMLMPPKLLVPDLDAGSP